MSETSAQQPTYALGHSEPELERLRRQARAFEPFTRQLFQEAGIGAGMRVLDIGCGGGDVAFLAADLTGAEGEVIGVDRAPAAIQWARARTQSRGFQNVKFLGGDPAAMEFDRPFDAVVGRLVLMYYPEPTDAVRKLARHVRSGGLVIFQEFDLANCRSAPFAPAFERSIGWIRQTLSATGARIQMGLELYEVFLAAGLPGPSMRMDALIGGGPDCPAYQLATDVTGSLLPVMEKLKIATPAEVDMSSLQQRMRDEVVTGKGVVVSPGLIGAWSRKIA